MARNRLIHCLPDVRSTTTVLFSGGQDSTIVLGLALEAYGPDNVRCVSIDYGQKHAIELDAARSVIAHFEDAYSDRDVGVECIIPHEIITLGEVFAGMSPLTNDAEPLETYADARQMEETIGDRIEKTFVPMRNAVFLMLAANRAVCAGSRILLTGVCEADNANYPDCRESFVASAQATVNEALGFDGGLADRCMHPRTTLGPAGDAITFRVLAPLSDLSKAESIVLALSTPYTYAALALSHTAYDGAYPPTGKDHASVLRADGFEKAGVPDPLVMRAVRERKMPLPETANYAGWRRGNWERWAAEDFAWNWRRLHRGGRV